MNQSIFCMGIIIKRKQHLRLPVLIWCGQLSLLPSQIPGKKINTFVFLLFFFGQRHQREKVASQHLTLPLLVWYGHFCLFSNHIRGFFDHYYCLEPIDNLGFCMEIIIKGRQHLKLPLLVVGGHVSLWSNQIPGFFDHQYIWKLSIDVFL